MVRYGHRSSAASANLFGDDLGIVFLSELTLCDRRLLRATLASLIATLLMSASLATAEQLGTFFDRYAMTPALERKVAEGWEIQKVGNRLHYKCLTCEGDVEALLEMVPLPDHTSLTEFPDAFMKQKRQHCSELVTANEGHCIRTTRFKIRDNGPIGFKSESVFGDKRHFHQVFATHDYALGPVRISSKVWADKDESFLEGLAQRLYGHMLMLTHYW